MAATKINSDIAPWLLERLGQYQRPPRERQPKARREFSCLNGRGQLSPFAGREPSAEDAEAMRTRQRAFEMASGAGAKTTHRGVAVLGTSKQPRRK